MDYKFILIPVAFILLRMWSFLENVFFVYYSFPILLRPRYHHLHMAINFIAVSPQARVLLYIIIAVLTMEIVRTLHAYNYY